MERFPTVETLASGSEDQVLALWQGLGYYRRAKLLRSGAEWILKHGMPASIDEWRKVPGVGVYTAAAIGSISQDLPAAAVDGNVERVFARLAANSATGPTLLKEARVWAESCLDLSSPGDWNQALMELGATICTPRDPKCEACPIAQSCVAKQTWSVEKYPAKAEKPTIVRQRHSVYVPFCGGKLGVRRVAPNDWWAGMWEFPRVVEGKDPVFDWAESGWKESLGTFRHQVTQHRIDVEASLIRTEFEVEGLAYHFPASFDGLAMPSPQRKVLRLALQALGFEQVSVSNME